MRRAPTFALFCLLLAGCATGGGRKPAESTTKAGAIAPSPFVVVGHVLAVDFSTMNVVIDVAPYAVLPFDFDGKILLARTEDLRPTAKLQASPYLRGHTLGARLLAGRPNAGDEVVIPPTSR